MPANMEPFFRSFSKDGVETVFPGKVRAGATQAIKKGEICCFNKTAGYWVPVSAVADAAYPLAIAKVEQKSTDLERYMEFYGLHPEDEFEFPMDASRALALGDTFTLTASDSQTLTYSAAGFPVAVCVHDGNYPEAGISIRNQSHVVVRFLENVSWWGYTQSLAAIPRPRTIVTADNLTLRPDQCFGSVVYVSRRPKPSPCPPASGRECMPVRPGDRRGYRKRGPGRRGPDHPFGHGPGRWPTRSAPPKPRAILWSCGTTRPRAGPPGACPGTWTDGG